MVILFIINGILDIYVSNVLQHSRAPLYVTWNDITKQSIDADLIVMGNSRAAWQFSPKIMDSLLNTNSYVLGFPASGLNRQIIKYNIYNQYQKEQPKNIIINIDYYNTLSWTQGVYREQFFPFMTDRFCRKQIRKVEPFNIIELSVPIYRYTTYKGLWSLLREESPLTDGTYKGFLPNDKVWDGKEYEKLTTFHFSSNEETIQMFDDFLKTRTSENINIIFCYAPIYIGLTNKVDNLEKVYTTFQLFADKYNIPILDYTYSNISKDTAYFENASHLNKTGAELFTMQLCHDLDSLGILQH